MRIFFFGGTFDPPHIGHCMIVENCLKLCDKFIFMPANQSPFKMNKPKANSYHRLNMLKILINNDRISIDTFEIDSKGKNYTYNTIEYLKKKYLKSDLSMVIGFDQLLNFKKWYKHQDIINQVNIVCFSRNKNQGNIDMLNIKNIKFLNDFDYDISSSRIRELLLKPDNCKIENFLNPNVMKYIKENKLYES